MPISIRPNTPEDGERVIDIWRRAVDATHHFLAPADRRAIDAEVQAFLPGASLALAVDEGDRPIGFMLVAGSHMEALFIDPDRRGQGVGAALVDHATAQHPTLTTDVNEQNTQAVGFYHRLGFRLVGRSEQDGQGRPYPVLHLERRLAPMSPA
jgi:putative acetyltransferase